MISWFSTKLVFSKLTNQLKQAAPEKKFALHQCTLPLIPNTRYITWQINYLKILNLCSPDLDSKSAGSIREICTPARTLAWPALSVVRMLDFVRTPLRILCMPFPGVIHS